MASIKLWRFDTASKVPDQGWRWFFWQASPPYKLQGNYTFELIPDDLLCEVYTLGSRDLLYSGVLSSVPRSMRCYLSEVRVCVASLIPAAPSRPSESR